MLPLIYTRPVVADAEQQRFIDLALSSDFPWFWQQSQTHDSRPYFWEQHLAPEQRPDYDICNAPFFSHTLMTRSRDPAHSGVIASEYYQVFAALFHDWMTAVGLQYTHVYRMNLNLTMHHSSPHTVPHLDHEFEHYNFIMYLDTPPNSPTLIYDQGFRVITEIPAVAGTAVSFPAQFHSHRYPPPEARRTVLVVTYGLVNSDK